MKETYEYTITDFDEKTFNIKCKITYNTENDYDTDYYFFDGNNWQKDFIDLNKLSPENKADQDKYEEFITRVHDYMVHGALWEDLRNEKDNDEIQKDQYKLNIKSIKL
ncbi:hypothetical protein [Methanosphaera sp. WGK6]|uniref:hypothetical protein n=1 Tax=Methanosphaera sp. WGK6 TaxID=1561964 RepID=UPI00084C4676|nr:hypothetical protein [Methanosphaera sp. WGK6]OED30909.1 hypothetical protein NL43_00955 [Methanosphaera sp. WGK6]